MNLDEIPHVTLWLSVNSLSYKEERGWADNQSECGDGSVPPETQARGIMCSAGKLSRKSTPCVVTYPRLNPELQGTAVSPGALTPPIWAWFLYLKNGYIKCIY